MTDPTDPTDLADLADLSRPAAERWWWDLAKERAVRDDERGPDRDVLGPYPTREAAEAWRESHEVREDAWEDEDERWEGEEPDSSRS